MSTQPPLNRRILPVPIETTTRSQRVGEAPLTPPESLTSFDGLNEDKENPSVTTGKIQAIEKPSPPPINLQLPQLTQPLETSRRTQNTGTSTLQSEESQSSTTTQFNREEIAQAQDDASTPKPLRSAMAQPPQSPTHLTPLKLTSSPRFIPQLIETTRRSRRVAQPYLGPIAELASPLPSDREDAPTPTIRKTVVPHHKLTIWMPPDIVQAPVQKPKRPPPRHLDGRSDLLTPHESRSSSLPPPLRPYRQGSMRPHCNTRMNSNAGDMEATPTGDAPDIIIHGFGGHKQLFSADDQWLGTPTPSTSASDRLRDSSYFSTPSLSGSFDSSSQSQEESQHVRELPTSQHLARTRESCDERYSGYLLSLAAVAAESQLQEKRLQEQVESSFPNRDFCYEPVSHWGPGEEDSDESRANTGSAKDFTDVPRDEKVHDGEGTVRLIESDEESDDDFEGPPELPHEMLGRKESAQARHVVDLGNGILMGVPDAVVHEAGMTMEEILAHEEKLKRLRAESTFRKIAEEASAPSFKDPFWTNGTTKDKSKVLGAKKFAELRGEEKKREEELRVMREAAAPPMLGDDLVFRMCPSPQRTKCETDQRHKVRAPKATNGGGLWGGYCVTDGGGDRKDQVKRGPQLLETPGTHTPLNEREDSGVSISGPPHTFLPLTEGAKIRRPGHSRMTSGGLHLLNGLDARLKVEVAKARREEQIKEEFDDSFITQVYNYLSLGWPLLAREYDDELSKIAGVGVDELRVNDARPEGNIGIAKVFWANDASQPPEKEMRESPHGTKENSEDSSKTPVEANSDSTATTAVSEDTPNGETNGENGTISGNPRWMALKSYIHEWARQHPDLENEGATEWGDETSRRKGSWAI